MRKQTRIWTCADGSMLRVCDMSDTHLINALASKQRWAEREFHRQTMAGYSLAGYLTGEMAVDQIERELFYLESEGPGVFLEHDELYDALVRESIRRGFHDRLTRAQQLFEEF